MLRSMGIGAYHVGVEASATSLRPKVALLGLMCPSQSEGERMQHNIYIYISAGSSPK